MTRAALAVCAVFLIFTAATTSVFAQAGLSLEAEIQNMEKTASEKGISAEKRHDALVRLARLRQLSGDIEGAAKNWLEAAAAIPGSVDDEALLFCSYCLAAMGEWDRASSALQPLLAKSAHARFLDISINAIKTGDVSLLGAIAGDPQYAQMKSQIYFMLYKTSRAQAAEIWRQRLEAEFPESPESRLVANFASSGVENKTAVVVRPSPFWLFIGGLDSLPIEKVETAASPVSKSVSTASQAYVEKAPVPQAQKATPPQTPAPSAALQAYVEKAPVPQAQKATPPQTPAPSATAPQKQAPQAASARLQTGLYSRIDNAEVQIEKLKKAGFSPVLEQRGDKWVVIVISNTDANSAIKDLKTAGFDSFPIK